MEWWGRVTKLLQAGERAARPLQWDASCPLPLSLTCLPYTEMEIGATDQVRATITKEVETQKRQFGGGRGDISTFTWQGHGRGEGDSLAGRVKVFPRS